MATVAPTNYRNIIRGIESVLVAAQAIVDDQLIPYTASRRYGSPTKEMIEEAGTPYLGLARGQLVGYAPGGTLVGPDAALGVQTTEPVWDFEVVAFYPTDAYNPNFDNAAEQSGYMWQTLLAQNRLPISSVVQSTPASTTRTFAVSDGDGKLFRSNMDLTITIDPNTVLTGVVQSVAGDVVTLYDPLGIAPPAGAVASQATVGFSYPYGARPDYAELADGSGWIVATMTVRCYEQLLTQFP